MVEVFVTIQRVTSQPSTPPTTSLQLGHSVPRLLTFAGAGLYPQQRGGIPLIPQPTPEPLWAETPKAYSCWGKKHQSCKKPLKWTWLPVLIPTHHSSVRTIRVQSIWGYHTPTILDRVSAIQQSLTPLTRGTLSPSKVMASKPYLRLTWWQECGWPCGFCWPIK